MPNPLSCGSQKRLRSPPVNARHLSAEFACKIFSSMLFQEVRCGQVQSVRLAQDGVVSNLHACHCAASGCSLVLLRDADLY